MLQLRCEHTITVPLYPYKLQSLRYISAAGIMGLPSFKF